MIELILTIEQARAVARALLDAAERSSEKGLETKVLLQSGYHCELTARVLPASAVLATP